MICIAAAVLLLLVGLIVLLILRKRKKKKMAAALAMAAEQADACGAVEPSSAVKGTAEQPKDEKQKD